MWRHSPETIENMQIRYVIKSCSVEPNNINICSVNFTPSTADKLILGESIPQLLKIEWPCTNRSQQRSYHMISSSSYQTSPQIKQMSKTDIFDVKF